MGTNMEELLKAEDYDGLALYCEQEELKVRDLAEREGEEWVLAKEWGHTVLT